MDKPSQKNGNGLTETLLAQLKENEKPVASSGGNSGQDQSYRNSDKQDSFQFGSWYNCKPTLEILSSSDSYSIISTGFAENSTVRIFDDKIIRERSSLYVSSASSNSLQKELAESKHRLSKKEQSRFYKLSRRGIDDQERGLLWMRASGAYQAMSLSEYNSSLSYEHLVNHALEYPNLNNSQIEVDLKRTFPEEEFYRNEEVINKMRRILRAYAVRNPTIGYCQGFNFIVGRLLQVLPEEETFWLLTQIIESLLPLNYYSNMVGALVDQKIYFDILKKEHSDLLEFLDGFGFEPAMIAFQWFSCFFSYNLHWDTLKRIWDWFFLKGSKVLFRVSLGIIHMMKEELMEAEEFQDIFATLDKFPRSLNNPEVLLQTSNMKRYQITNSFIEKQRAIKVEQVVKEIQGFSKQMKESANWELNRQKFLTKFSMYTAFSKLHANKQTDSEDLIKVMACDHNWPICLFDFTHKNRIADYFAFRVHKETVTIIDSHFYQEHLYKREAIANGFETTPPQSKNSSPIKQQSLKSRASVSKNKNNHERRLLIERNVHHCSPEQIEFFKKVLMESQPQLYTSPSMDFKIDDIRDSEAKIKQFLKELSSIHIDQQMKILKRSNSSVIQAFDIKELAAEPTPKPKSKQRTVSINAPQNKQLSAIQEKLREKGSSMSNLATSSFGCLFQKLQRKELEETLRLLADNGMFSCFIEQVESEEEESEAESPMFGKENEKPSNFDLISQ